VYNTVRVRHRIARVSVSGDLLFTAQRYANAVYVVVVCPVCPSHAGIVPERLNVGSRKQRHTIAQGLWFSDAKDRGEIPTGLLSTGAPNRRGVG